MLAIGNTPLLKLEKISGPDMADIYIKYEGTNPTGSMKDRKATAMVVVDSGLKYLNGRLYK